jgi:hypothetical protein
MFIELNDVKTWEDLENYLLGAMDYADDSKSNANSSFTKEQHWNSLIGDCMKHSGDLPIRTKDLLIKRVKKDFPISESNQHSHK